MLHFRLYRLDMWHLLDVRGSQTLESLPILVLRNRRNRLCVMFIVFFDVDGYERGPTSRHSVGPEIQKDCNFEAHV